MVGKLAAILFILPVIYAHVEIDLSKLNEKERDVRISGNSVHTISDQDMKTFGLTEESLRKSVWSYFGLLPDNVYVKGPTLFGDLYKILSWEPVKRVLTPIKADILSVNSEPRMLFKKEFTNRKNEELSFKTELHRNLANTVSAKWEKEGKFVDKIRHLFDLNVTNDSSYFSFVSKFGDDFERTTPLKITSEVEITLKPKQKLIAELFATKKTVLARVDYETNLTGNVAVNFEKEYKGHRFWAVDINTLLTADGLKKTLYSSEFIEFVHFTDAKVLLRDALTNEVITTVPATMF